MITTHSIQELFRNVLPKLDASFEVRNEQIELAERISHAFVDNTVLVAEAGTGVGKSYAYLLPVLQHVLQGNHAVIVTATIALQHQLADKDIPKLQKLFQTTIPVTVLKGRANYLCKARLSSLFADEQNTLFKAKDIEDVEKIIQWESDTDVGDKEDLTHVVSVSSQLWSEIATHEYGCGGLRCQKRNYDGCYFVHARRKAKKSGIIITNYSLLAYHLIAMEQKEHAMSDAGEQEDKTGEGLLPEDAVYILDEVHNLKDIIRQSRTVSMSKAEMEQMYDQMFGKRGVIIQEQVAYGGSFEHTIQTQIERIRQKFREIIEELGSIDAYIIAQYGRMEPAHTRRELNYNLISHDAQLLDKFTAFHGAVQAIEDVCTTLSTQFGEEDTIRELLMRYIRWWNTLCNLALVYAQPEGEEVTIRWYRINATHDGIVYALTPLFVHDLLHEQLFNQKKSIICTSATITVQNTFEHWIHQIGVPEDCTQVSLPSPFPYATNVLLTIATDAPSITHDENEYKNYLYNVLPQCLDISEGRALVLCTSYAMVKEIAQALKKKEPSAPWSILVQEKGKSNSALAHAFRRDPHSVLIATATFWEGFDAPGDTLKMLIITRLPFTNPTNLFFEVERQYIQARGGNPFSQLAIPEAELRLRQGVGRLMRSFDDSGVVFITDNRIYTKQYGQYILQALPSCKERIDITENLLAEMSAHLKMFS